MLATLFLEPAPSMPVPAKIGSISRDNDQMPDPRFDS